MEAPNISTLMVYGLESRFSCFAGIYEILEFFDGSCKGVSLELLMSNCKVQLRPFFGAGFMNLL